MATFKIHHSKENPDNWRWRLILWLTRGEIEVVPLLPRRAISPNETLIVRLGYEGAHNTVEVKHLLNTATELLWVDSPQTDLIPNTFVAVDVAAGKETKRIVGTFINWKGKDTMLVELPWGTALPTQRRREIHLSEVKAVYYAPVGYRAPA